MTDAVLVTGGTGTVGTALVRRLVSDGTPTRVLSRSDASASAALALGADARRGDVLDAESVRRAAEGCALVFHVAGRSGLCLPDADAMERLNVEGTETVVRAAADAGVRRLVLTSSAATIGEARGEIGDERTAHRGSFLSRYERSKHAAEERAFRWGADLGLEVISVNPSSVQGPGRTTGSARLLLDLIRGRLPVLVDTWISLVDVEDCASGHVLAASEGLPGERYVLCGSTLRLREAASLMQGLWGAPGDLLWLPRPAAAALLRPVGLLGSAAAGLTHRRVRLCHEAVTTLLHGHRYDGSRATRELGLRYTPIEESLMRTLEWYSDESLIPPRASGAGD